MVDFGLILDRVTIRNILIDAGIEASGTRMACPIHNGKNRTSFRIADQTFKCFSCDAGGGLTELTMLLHKCTRQEALEQLCRMANVPFQTWSSFPRRKKRETKKTRITRLIENIRWHRDHPRRRNHLLESSEYIEAVERLEWLRLYRDSLDTRLRMIKRAIKIHAMSAVDFYTKEQTFLHQLEEVDKDINLQKYQVNIIKRTLTRNEHSTRCDRS